MGPSGVENSSWRGGYENGRVSVLPRIFDDANVIAQK